MQLMMETLGSVHPQNAKKTFLKIITGLDSEKMLLGALKALGLPYNYFG